MAMETRFDVRNEDAFPHGTYAFVVDRGAAGAGL